jgi:hypothetical protein
VQILALCAAFAVAGVYLAPSSHAQLPRSPDNVPGPDTTRASPDEERPNGERPNGERSNGERPAGNDAAPDSLPAGPFRESTPPEPSLWQDDPLQRGPIRSREGARSRSAARPTPPSQMPPKPEVGAPDLIQRYRTARRRILAQRILLEGRRGVPVLPPARIPTPSDSLRPMLPPSQRSPAGEEDTTTFVVESVHALQRLERGWFQKKFADTGWSFLGSGRYFTLFDTTKTTELRARLQAEFGDPTQELADFTVRGGSNTLPDDFVQFEYWFVVNDSIPVKVMDAGGPRDRGLIVAADQRVRDRLYALRQALLRPLRRGTRAPYVDYWYEEETRRWYRTGFDGDRFFLERIYRSQLAPGRPTLE